MYPRHTHTRGTLPPKDDACWLAWRKLYAQPGEDNNPARSAKALYGTRNYERSGGPKDKVPARHEHEALGEDTGADADTDAFSCRCTAFCSRRTTCELSRSPRAGDNVGATTASNHGAGAYSAA